jgi:hypothetical protein
MSSYIKRTEKTQINNLRLHLKLLEKPEQAKPKKSRRRKIIKIKAKINEIEAKNPYKGSTKKRDGSFKNKNKIDKPLTNLTKMRK